MIYIQLFIVADLILPVLPNTQSLQYKVKC